MAQPDYQQMAQQAQWASGALGQAGSVLGFSVAVTPKRPDSPPEEALPTTLLLLEDEGL